MPRRDAATWSVAFGFIACVFLSNLFVSNVGTPTEGGPHVLPVGFGLEAPSGVVFVGLSLALRDMLHELAGLKLVVFLIVLGGALSAALAPQLAVASAVAYLVAEFSDLGVYSRIRQRSPVLGGVVSNLVGSLVDSAIFLTLAFGLDALTLTTGSVIGKFQWSILGVPMLIMMRAGKKPSAWKKGLVEDHVR